jgi:hypothetical protein
MTIKKKRNRKNRQTIFMKKPKMFISNNARKQKLYEEIIARYDDVFRKLAQY